MANGCHIENRIIWP